VGDKLEFTTKKEKIDSLKDLPDELITKYADEILSLNKVNDKAGVERKLMEVGVVAGVTAKEAARLARANLLIKASKYLDEVDDSVTLIGKTNIDTIIADTTRIVVKDPALKGGVNVVKGSYQSASGIFDGMTKGWDKVPNKSSDVNIFTSPDKKWTVNLRTVSSSEQQIAEKGYRLEATMDVREKVGKDTITKEIKFITKALQ